MEGRGTQKWKLDNLVGTNYQGFVTVILQWDGQLVCGQGVSGEE